MYIADRPSNTKREGVSIYYKNCFPLKIVNIIFEIQIGDKLCNFISLYQTPNENQDAFETLAEHLEDVLCLNNPFW